MLSPLHINARPSLNAPQLALQVLQPLLLRQLVQIVRLRQSGPRRLAQRVLDVFSRQNHRHHHLIERDDVEHVRHQRVLRALQRSRRRHRVSLDARHLHQSLHRIARQSKHVLDRHRGRVFDLLRRSAQQEARGARGHRAGHAHFGLTAGLCTRNGRVDLGEIADDAGDGERVDAVLDGDVFVVFVEIIEQTGHDAARSARGRRDDDLAARVVLGNSQRVGEEIGVLLQRIKDGEATLRLALLRCAARYISRALRGRLSPPGSTPLPCKPISTQRFMVSQIILRKS